MPALTRRQRRRRIILLLITVFAIVDSVVIAVLLKPWDSPKKPAASTSNTNGQQPSTTDPVEPAEPNGLVFLITVPSVSGLYPGSSNLVPVSISNPFDFDIRVSRLEGKLMTTSNPGCALIPSNIRVEVRPTTLPLPLDVTPQTTVAAGSIVVSMPNSVIDACQNATFTIRFSGTAAKVNE